MDPIYALENRGFEYFYHWLFYMLSGLRFLEKEDKKVDVYIPWLKDYGFQLDSLNYFKDKFNFIFELPGTCDRPIVKFDGELAIGGDQIAVEGLDYLRRKILSRQNFKVKPGRYVYLTRKNSEKIITNLGRGIHHSIINEEALIEMLASFGFEYIALETLGFDAKIQLFCESEIILSPFGGGLSPVVFCNNDQTIIQLKSIKEHSEHYGKICSYLNIPYYCFSDINYDDQKFNIHVKIDKLHELLKGIIPARHS